MINSGINEPYENIDNNPTENVSVSDAESANTSEEFSYQEKIIEGMDQLTSGVKSASKPVSDLGRSTIDNKRSAINNFETTLREKLNNMSPALTKFITGVIANVIIVWIVWKIGSHVIWFNSLPRNVLATMFPPGYQYLLDVLRENEKDKRCTGDVEENVGGKQIKAEYTDDQRDSMTLKKTCCPHLEHPIPEGEETMVACFPLGTGQKTIDSLNSVNPNFKVWNNDYSECVLYGVWKNKNEQENDAVRLQNLQTEKKIKMAQRGGSGRKRQRGGETVAVVEAVTNRLLDMTAVLGELRDLARAATEGGKWGVIIYKFTKLLEILRTAELNIAPNQAIELLEILDQMQNHIKEHIKNNTNVQTGGSSRSSQESTLVKAIHEKIEKLIVNLEAKKNASQTGGGKRRMFRRQIGGDGEGGESTSDQLNAIHAKNLKEGKGVGFITDHEVANARDKHTLDATNAATAKHNSKQAEYEQQWDDMSQGMGGMDQMSAAAEQMRQSKILDMDSTQRNEYYQQFEGDKQKLQDQEIKTQGKLLKLKADWVNKRIKTNIKRDVDAAKAKFKREQLWAKQKARRDYQALKREELLKEKLKDKDEQNKEKQAKFKMQMQASKAAGALAGSGAFVTKWAGMFMNGIVSFMKWVFGCSFDQTGEGMGWFFGYQTMGGILTRFGLGIKTTISYVVYSCMVAGSDNVIASAFIGTCGVSLGIAVANLCWFSSVPLMWALYEFNLGRIGMYFLIFAILLGPAAMILTWPLGVIFIFYTVLLVIIKLWIGAFSNHGEKFKKQLRNCSNIRASLRRLFLILTFFTAMSSLSSDVVSGMLLCFIWIEYKNYVPSVAVSLQNAEKAVDNLTKPK